MATAKQESKNGGQVNRLHPELLMPHTALNEGMWNN